MALHESPSGGPSPRLDLRQVDGTNPFSQEALKGIGVGQAVIVVHYDTMLNGENLRKPPQIAVIEEKLVKLSSGRYEGQLGVPLETAKVGEGPRSRIWGALAELYDDQTLPTGHLFFINGGFGQFLVNGNIVKLATIVHDGSKTDIPQPTSGREVAFKDWMGTDAFLRDGNVRGLAWQSVQTAWEQGLFRAVIAGYSDPSKRHPVFPEGFSMEAFYEDRERLPDVVFDLGLGNH